MRNCKTFLLGVTSQEGIPMVPSTSTPQFCFFPSRLTNVEVLRYHQADFLWVLHVSTNVGALTLGRGRSKLGMAGCRGQRESCTTGQQPAGAWDKGKGLWASGEAKKDWLGTGGWPSKLGKGLWPRVKKEKGLRGGGLTCTKYVTSSYT